jgi:uncharacterized protein YbjQ (UPF0145 family)
MKKLLSMVVFGVVVAAPAQARDTALMMPIAAAMDANGAKDRLGDSVRFYFGKQATPRVLNKITSDQTNLKTNAFGKSAETSCNWVFLSAMLSLKKRAEEVGANAVVNIVSNYQNVEMSSETEFECHDGALMSGVALKADFVKVADK